MVLPFAPGVIRSVTAAVARAADASDNSKKEAGRAMTWLKQAVAARYKEVANLKKTKDLDALREQEDFKKMVAEVEGGGKGGK